MLARSRIAPLGGRYLASSTANRAEQLDAVRSIAWLPTLSNKGSGALQARHLRFSLPLIANAARYVFVLDCSASMANDGGLARAKGLLLSCLRRIRRDHAQAVLVCFGGHHADIRFGPAIPTGWNESWIDPIGGGGGTPLTLGLDEAVRVAKQGSARFARGQKHLILLTDGRTTERPSRPRGFDQVTIIDFEQGNLSLHRCAILAQSWGARCLPIMDIC